MRGGIKYGGVARSSDEYTLLILRINNIDELVEKGGIEYGYP